jgi:ribonucleoside-diphosphate reductase alpha chain
MRALEARYLKRDVRGRVIESPEQVFSRVARSIASAEVPFQGAGAASRREEAFFEALSRLDFLPNSPTLMNAGQPGGQLSACFVLPVEDSVAEIFDSLKLMALIQQSGGGTGFSFSQLRPRGDSIASTGGTASGPVSFMGVFDCATEKIQQGGRRRGANMGVLRVDHPDIGAFLDAKLDGCSFSNFNQSIAVTDEFMAAVADVRPFAQRSPRSGVPAGTVQAPELFDRIARAAWISGDPGLIFADAVNRANPLPALGPIEATNPCGEVLLLAYEACNLGSINLSHILREPAERPCLDREHLAATTRLAVRFVDDVIQVSSWPDPRVAAAVNANRKIGLGVMGFAELLVLLGIPYASDRAVALASEVMELIAEHALAASRELADERGPFPNWERSTWYDRKPRVRNATLTSIAPAGTLSILAGTSPGIEPLFALAYRREHVLGDQRLCELNPLFLRYAQRRGFYSDELVRDLASFGSLAGVSRVPREVAEFVSNSLGDRRRTPPARARGVPAARGQRRVEDHQPARIGVGRRDRGDLSPRLGAGAEGHHRLPLRQRASPSIASRDPRDARGARALRPL